MAIFSNFKNQSQRFMTIFRNFKNQLQRFMTLGSLKSNGITFMTIFKNFINQGVTNHSKKKNVKIFRIEV